MLFNASGNGRNSMDSRTRAIYRAWDNPGREFEAWERRFIRVGDAVEERAMDFSTLEWSALHFYRIDEPTQNIQYLIKRRADVASEERMTLLDAVRKIPDNSRHISNGFRLQTKAEVVKHVEESPEDWQHCDCVYVGYEKGGGAIFLMGFEDNDPNTPTRPDPDAIWAWSVK